MMEFVCKCFHELTVDELYDILSLRVSVFVVEQHCPYEETDGIDRNARHLFMKEGDDIVAYLRFFAGEEDGMVQIGRVVSRIRNHGYGRMVLDKAVVLIREISGVSGIVLEAQVYAIPFYEKAGFMVVSEPFDEDGIPHVKMELRFL